MSSLGYCGFTPEEHRYCHHLAPIHLCVLSILSLPSSFCIGVEECCCSLFQTNAIYTFNLSTAIYVTGVVSHLRDWISQYVALCTAPQLQHTELRTNSMDLMDLMFRRRLSCIYLHTSPSPDLRNLLSLLSTQPQKNAQKYLLSLLSGSFGSKL